LRVGLAGNVGGVRLALKPHADPAEYGFVHTIRTRFCETDAMGVIHHAAYLAYLEEARVAFLDHVGHPHREVRAGGVDLALLEVFVQYRRPLRFDEQVAVHLTAGCRSGTTFQMAYLLRVDGESRATAVTVHGGVDGSGRAVRLPRWNASARRPTAGRSRPTWVKMKPRRSSTASARTLPRVP
jgi:acyl-CoA thioester hydrolase